VLAGVPFGVLAALGALACASSVVEDAGASWAALYSRNELGTSAAVAGFALVALQAAMTVGRLLGDRAVDRFGSVRVVRTGGLMTALGMGVALAAPSLGSTVLGFAVAGLGVATVIPAAMQAADDLPGLPAGTGLTIVSWLMRVGFLVSPPVVGLVADLTSLRVGLLGTVAAGLVMVALSPALRVRQPVDHSLR
jgi:MFS family permease